MIRRKRFLQLITAPLLSLILVLWFWLAYLPGVFLGTTAPPEFLIEGILFIFFSMALVYLHESKISAKSTKWLFILSLIFLVLIPSILNAYFQYLRCSGMPPLPCSLILYLLGLPLTILKPISIFPFLITFFFILKYLRWQ